MPRLHEVSYSREATIAAFRDYYQFLTQFYLSEAMIEEPPTDGWPSITNEKVRLLGKNEEVAELMRHLPYISDRGLLAPHSEVAHWPNLLADIGDSEIDDLRFISEDLGWENVPPSALGILFDEDRIVLDTKFGVIHWVAGVREEAKQDPAREGILDNFWDCTPEDEEWRVAPAWAIADFFEVLKKLHSDLVYVPIHKTRVEEWFDGYGTSDDKSYLRSVRQVYKEHGWPDLSVYDREKCLESVDKLIEEQFPDEHGW